MESRGRFAELLGALSLASDRARGQPPESGLGTTILATRIAAQLQLPHQDLVETYYLAATRTLGCSSSAMEVAPLVLGDDLSFSHAIHLCDRGDDDSVRSHLERWFATDADDDERRLAIERMVQLRPQFPAMAASTGQQARALGQRLPVPDGVPSMLADLDCRWDGVDGSGPKGEDIPVPLRIVEFATVAELFRRAGGVPAASDVAARRAGTQFAPEVCEAFLTACTTLVDGLDASSLWELFLATEPEPIATVDGAARRRIAEVSADFADNKSGWFVGNSRRVAQLADAIGRELQMVSEHHEEVVLAALLHDLGRCGIPNGVLDKPGPLTPRERRLVETQLAETEQILAVLESLRPIAALAASARERLDGSGHPRGTKAKDPRVQILACADLTVAVSSPRPWRPALTEEAVVGLLRDEARHGRLAPDVVDVVLRLHGRRGTKVDAPRPDGLTRREVDVLMLLAKGLVTKQIAAELGIAYKTVDNHVQNLYRKIGANTRTAAAMYAVEQGLYDHALG